MARIRNLSKDREQANDEAVQWLHSQLNKDQSLQGEGPNSSQREEPSPRQIRVEQLQRQQEELQKQIEDLMVGDCSSNTTTLNTLKQTLGAASNAKTEQELLLEQLRAAWAPKEVDRDPNKALLKALITRFRTRPQGSVGPPPSNLKFLEESLGMGSSPWQNSWHHSTNRKKVSQR